MDTVDFVHFKRLDIRIARIVKAEEVEGADKLLKLTLDVGELGERTIAAGIKQWYKPEDLEGKLVPYLANLEPKELRGVKSKGMLIAAAPSRKTSDSTAGEETAVLLHPDKDVAPGTKLK